jgi:hypothetical protein
MQDSHNINLSNKFFENLTDVRYLGSTEINKNCINEEFKRTLSSGILATIHFRIYLIVA